MTRYDQLCSVYVVMTQVFPYSVPYSIVSIYTIVCGWVEEGDACLKDDDPHKGGVLQGGDVDAIPN